MRAGRRFAEVYALFFSWREDCKTEKVLYGHNVCWVSSCIRVQWATSFISMIWLFCALADVAKPALELLVGFPACLCKHTRYSEILFINKARPETSSWGALQYHPNLWRRGWHTHTDCLWCVSELISQMRSYALTFWITQQSQTHSTTTFILTRTL